MPATGAPQGHPSPQRAKGDGGSRYWDWVNLAVLLLGALAIWRFRILGPVVLPQPVGRWNGDLYDIYYPLYAFAYRGAQLLPAWNPYQMAGTPTVGYLAGGLYYPPNFLSVIEPVPRALGHLVAAHLALAGLGTWVLARSVGLSRLAACVAAVSFVCNPFFWSEHLRPMYFSGLAWVPLVTLFAGRAIVAPGVGAAALLGATVALQFATGHVQIVCYEAYVGIAIGLPAGLLFARTRGLGYAARCLGAVALAGAIAVGLAAAQILPTLEVVSHAGRDFGGLSDEQTLPMQASWTSFRNVATSHGVGLALVAFASLVELRRMPLVLVCVGVLLVADSIGLGTAAYHRVFYRLPGIALFRLPQQILALGAVALALLSGCGLDALRRRRSGVALVPSLAAMGVLLLAFRGEFGWFASLGFVATILGLIAAARWMPQGRAIAAGLVALVIVGERFEHTRNTVMVPPVNPTSFFATPPFVDFLRARVGFDRVVVVINWRRRFPVTEKIGSLYGFSVAQDYEPLTPTAYHRFVRGLGSVDPDPRTFGARYVAWPGANWRPLDLMSARYVVVARGVGWVPMPGSSRFRTVYGDADAVIYENTAALPRAFVVGMHRVVSDEEAAARAVLAVDFDPRAQVIIDREPIPSFDSDAWNGGDAAIVSQTFTTLTVRASTGVPAFLVVNDLYWPGWSATIDGEPTEVLRANYLFRAVRIPSGEHMVRFTYANRAARYGVALSASTVVMLAALLLRSRRVA